MLKLDKAITGQKWLVLGGESSERSQPLCTVQRSCFAPMKTRLDVFLAGKIDEDISEFQVVGSNHPSQSYRVYKGDTIIAEETGLIFLLLLFYELNRNLRKI